MPPRVLAVDWSGAKQWARRKIWLAEVVGGRLRRLEAGRGRSEVVQHLIDEAERDPHMVVGLDFAFSFPEWFLDEQGTEDAREVWGLAGSSAEKWLEACEPPFWGRPGRARPELPSHFRRTELEVQGVTGARPKSVFQVGGAGAVGTGSLRGMPYLGELADAGFSIWPFHEPDWPLVLEIYPRLLTGQVVKSDPSARVAYLDGAFPEIPSDLRPVAATSDDALDAAVSAVVMARHLDRIEALERPEDPTLGREGAIWHPRGGEASPADSSEATVAGASAVGAPTIATSSPAHLDDAESFRRDVSSDSGCPFCGLDPDGAVAESEHGMALRDVFPVSEGHTLVIPRKHVGSVFELPGAVQQDLWRLVARVRSELAGELDVQDFNVGVNDGPAAGQTISHAHIHVIPRRPGDVADPRGGIRWVRPDRAAYWDE